MERKSDPFEMQKQQCERGPNERGSMEKGVIAWQGSFRSRLLKQRKSRVEALGIVQRAPNVDIPNSTVYGLLQLQLADERSLNFEASFCGGGRTMLTPAVPE